MRQHDISLHSPQIALATLRAAEQPSWELVATICGIHFQDRFPWLQQYLRIQNVTGLRTRFLEEADRLTRELPGQMTDALRPLSAGEAEAIAVRIALLRETAAAANAIVFPMAHHDAVVIPLRRAA